ncbi:MAG: hypothetical protein SF162_07530 [bacterium]|nr:hypothetical protein [bacterium]
MRIYRRAEYHKLLINWFWVRVPGGATARSRRYGVAFFVERMFHEAVSDLSGLRIALRDGDVDVVERHARTRPSFQVRVLQKALPL